MKKVLLLAVLPILLCICCKKKECNEVSLTDYNSVGDWTCNANNLTLKQYIGDTLKVYGWKWKYGFYLISDKDRQNERNASAKGRSIYLKIEDYSLIPENPCDSMLFVTGIVQYYQEVFPGPFELYVTEIKKQ